MARTTEETIHNTVKAVTEDGTPINLSETVHKKKTHYTISEMNGKCNIMNLFQTMGKVCTSSSDITALGFIVDEANTFNEIKITNLTEFAKEIEISKESLHKLLKRAEENGLLYKVTTRHYLLNPFILISKGLSASSFASQESVQNNYKLTTGMISKSELMALSKLSEHLNLMKYLEPNDFNISVAKHYANKGIITEKQRDAILSENEVRDDEL